MGKVINFPGVTDEERMALPHEVIPPDKVLDGAVGHLKEAIVLGFDHNGEFYFSASHADGGSSLWLMEIAKNLLVQPESPDEGY